MACDPTPRRVQGIGSDLFRLHNPDACPPPGDELTKCWREFRAYIRQAEGFYRGAKVLHWKSSPLNYYYSFLNLAKAVCLVQGALPAQAAAEPRIIRHGLSARVVVGDPDVWRLAVGQADDVFPILYRVSFGMAINPNTLLDARDLLGYVIPIGWQLKVSDRASMIRSFLCRWAMLVRDREQWDVIAIPMAAPLDAMWNTLSAVYEELDPATTKDFAFRIFNMHAVVATRFRFFQRRQPAVTDQPGVWQPTVLQAGLQQALPNAVFENIHGSPDEFLLCLPYTADGLSLPLNEMIACYAIMFFLSSLVRYHPDYIDTIAESSDAWLIESFAKSAVITTVRYMTARVLGYTLIVSRL